MKILLFFLLLQWGWSNVSFATEEAPSLESVSGLKRSIESVMDLSGLLEAPSCPSLQVLSDRCDKYAYNFEKLDHLYDEADLIHQLSLPPNLLRPDDHLVVGDLHGSFQGMLFPLLTSGIAKINEEQPQIYYNVLTGEDVTAELCQSLDIDYIRKHIVVLPNLQLNPQRRQTITFLGDYVDRGLASEETLLTLTRLARLANCREGQAPCPVTVLLGNHELDILLHPDEPKIPGGLTSMRTDLSRELDRALRSGAMQALEFDPKLQTLYGHSFISVYFLHLLQHELSQPSAQEWREKNEPLLEALKAIIALHGQSSSSLDPSLQGHITEFVKGINSLVASDLAASPLRETLIDESGPFWVRVQDKTFEYALEGVRQMIGHSTVPTVGLRKKFSPSVYFCDTTIFRNGPRFQLQHADGTMESVAISPKSVSQVSVTPIVTEKD